MSTAGAEHVSSAADMRTLRAGMIWIAALCAAALSVWVRIIELQSSDVGWLISTAEWLLDGRKAGADFFEINPPGSTLIYVPAAVLGRIFGIGADLANELLVFTLAAGVVWQASRRLEKLTGGEHGGLLIATCLAVVFLILPSHAFGQREHIGALLLMPWLAMAAAARGFETGVFFRVLAGLGMGCAGIAKPHLLLIPLAVQLMEIYRVRSLRSLICMENFAAGAVLVLYVAAILIFFPEFLATVLPRAGDVYMPVRLPFPELLSFRGAHLWILLSALSAVFRTATGRMKDAGDVFLWASLAAGAVYLLQGKGFNYHIYPAVAFGFVSVMLRVIDAAHQFATIMTRIAGAGLAFGCVYWGYVYFDTPDAARTRALVKTIQKLDPSPRLLVLSADIGVGFPLVRQTQGVWVQREPFLWMAYGAYKLRARAAGDPRELAKLESYDALERKILAEDIVNGQPTIILAGHNRERNWLTWAQEDPVLAKLLTDYRAVTIVDYVTVLQRQ